MTDIDIDIEATPIKALHVKLIGIEYTLTPPKGSLGLHIAKQMSKANKKPELIMTSLHDWLISAVGEVDADKIVKRLEDPRDLLDIPHITQLMEKVSEKATGNPTT